MRPRPQGGSRLALRVFGLGLVMLLASAAVFAGLGQWFVRAPSDRDVAYLMHAVAVEACTRALDPARRGAAPVFPVRLAVYRDDGTLVSPPGGAPLRALSPEAVARLQRRTEILDGAVGAYLCPTDPHAYAAVERPGIPLSPGVLVVLLLASLLVLALLSLPIAWAIGAPLEAIRDVARRFGQGDLAARAAVRSDDFGDLAGAFNEMASRLEGALRAEREMLANVSHELRTPLARIRVVLETAQENPSRAQRLLQEISADLADLERLVEDVMDTVRLDPTGMNAQGTGLRARLVPTDLADLVAEADARFATLHAPRALTLDAPSEGLWVSGDARLLRRLLDNLVDNARKYADGPITLRAARVGERVQVSIEDRGEGIAPDDLARVFTPFFRADRSRARGTGGVGLGLALAKRIADAHGGELRLDSALGRGTTAVFTLDAMKQTDTVG